MDDLTDRLRTAVRRIKRIMRYRGSMQTDDFVDDLVARWVARGHLEAMREANAGYLAVSPEQAAGLPFPLDPSNAHALRWPSRSNSKLGSPPRAVAFSPSRSQRLRSSLRASR